MSPLVAAWVCAARQARALPLTPAESARRDFLREGLRTRPRASESTLAALWESLLR